MLNRDRVRVKTLMRLKKESFGGDRSAAGRYAANMRWRGRTGDLTDTNARDFAQFGELSAKQLKEVAARAKDLARQTGLNITPEAYYKDSVQSFNFAVPGFQQVQANERPLARDKANAKSIVKGFEDRLKRLSETPSGRVPKEKMREAVDLENRATGGKQILKADSQSKAKYIIEQLEIVEQESLKKAQQYRFRASQNLADKPRFSNLARQEFAYAESLGSKYGGAFEVYEALYDTQLDR